MDPPTSIVIVDDHAPFRAAARRLLEAGGFRIVGEACDGPAGIAAAGELHPEVVLVDIQLPGIDGFELTRRLAAAHPESAVVLVSSRESADYGDRVGASSAAGFIAKDRLSARALRALLTS